MNKKILDKFDNDTWYFADYDMAEERINEASAIKSICFTSVILDKSNWNELTLTNRNNISLLKKYIGHLIVGTTLAVSSIASTIPGLKTFLYHIDIINIEDINRDEILAYYVFIREKGSSDSTFNSRVSELNDFLQFLQQKGIISKNHVYRSIDRIKKPRKHTNKALSDNVINKVFGVIDKIPTKFSLMFLVIYSTGMRVSEACKIKKGKILKLDDGYFIEFYSTKMRKDVTNPIPENLYELLREYESKLDANEIFLFNREFKKPMYSATFVDKFNEFLLQFDIKDDKGIQYKFRPHDYRHTLATEMAKRNIPPTVIQAILHHESEEMTYSYIDSTSEDRIELFKKFVNNKGLVLDVNTETVRAEWLRENINAQILPNGVCSLPIKLGKCPHSNSCLKCEHFYTSLAFLDVHKKQVEKTEELIRIAEENKWIHQVKTNQENLVHLKAIINGLEGDGEIGSL